jgi:hypothetical protein
MRGSVLARARKEVASNKPPKREILSEATTTKPGALREAGPEHENSLTIIDL